MATVYDCVVKYLDSTNDQYPYLLKQIYDFPERLYYEGNINLLKKRCLTIVGTREITSYGKWVLNHFITDALVDLDIVFVSGLARGVDSFLHYRCLELGIGTIAVVPGEIYSTRSQTKIFKMMLKNGLVLAEFPKGTVLNKGMFVMRNRVLAGLSDLIIVVEAGLSSGSLITARYALDFNRDLYVIPGDIRNNMSHGCNMLAKQGAQILTCVEDFQEICGIKEGQVLFNI